ncbi:MAG TPA: xanthine dehydrogenase family protein molybdopterin-binding subunit [Blastocatellia bacterium]|nr:xanthine dehydrogenase family protein molybdopterin-binding subunit [Blastocatellia bacterium]
MAEYKWPEAEKRTLIGKRISRVDGPQKVSGKAKYTHDQNRPGMLFGKVLRSRHANARIVSIDTSAAEKMPGVKAVLLMVTPPAEVKWAGAELCAVAAVDGPTAEDAIRAIKVQYEILPHLVIDNDLSKAGQNAKPAAAQTKGDPDKGFSEAEVTSEGFYAIPVITHCCLETHGSVSEWEDDKNLLVHISTQAVSNVAGQMAGPLGIPAANIRVKQDHIGGGFGSKFSADSWDIAAAKLSKLAGGKPVKIMLERDAELMVAGTRPSAYAKIKVGAKKDGTITAWQSESWASAGQGGGGSPPLPYIFSIPNQRTQHTALATNVGSARAWRAPNHPQGCYLTMSALEDLAAQLNMSPVDLFLKNIALTGPRAEVYREEMKIAGELIGWDKKWHARGDKTEGSIKRGMGISIHTWGGGGNTSDCDVTIQPDGSVELKSGTQDLGTGTRTTLMIVVADTLGLPLNAVKVMIGDNRFPAAGASGGSTTIGGVSAASRRASLDALDQLFAKVAPSLDAKPEELEAVGGRVQVKGAPARGMSWKQACLKLGATPLTVRGKNPGPGTLISSGVGGVQMADVSVDVETGVVKINKIVAVQDCGLIIDLKTAESQVYGALIMGVGYALYEEKIMDQATGRMLNPNMEFYKLAGIGDIGDLVVHMMTGKGYDERGVIGLGEPPVVSPGAVIGNAVANAIGVRVPSLPLTPDRVLDALEKKGGNNARI